MERKVKCGTLAITTRGNQSETEISGTGLDIMFNWIALTHQVCKTLNVPPTVLAAMLPQAIADYHRNDLKCEIKVAVKGGVTNE